MPGFQGRANYSESDALERFVNNILVTPEGHWLWQAGHTEDGYGRFSYHGRWEGAHRVAWQLFRGPIPSGLDVLHKCDIRDCVRPSDLFLGTNEVNVADKMAKGRIGRVAKLSPEAVKEIRSRHEQGESQTRLGKEFGVTGSAIHKIVHRIHWRHI
jgi:hypothetical protein